MDAPKKKKSKPPRSGEQRKEKRRVPRSTAANTMPPPSNPLPTGTMPLVSVPVIGSSGHLGTPMGQAMSGLPPGASMGMPGHHLAMGGALSSHAAQLAANSAHALYANEQAAAAAAVAAGKSKASAKQKDAKAGKKRPSYISEIKDMMYTFGDARDTNEETALLIEAITRSHVIDLLRRANQNATRRGARIITVEDIVFQIKRDPPKMNRLKEFLSWKEIRKRARNTTEKPTDDPTSLEDMKSVDPRPRKMRIKIPWDFPSSLKPLADQNKDDSDGETKEMDAQNQQRLRVADEITRVMTREQYLEYSECRQASFTYKKAKKFREWVGMTMSDDTLEVLGYLAWEVVGLITQTALEVKHLMDKATAPPAQPAAQAATGDKAAEKSPATSSAMDVSKPTTDSATDASHSADTAAAPGDEAHRTEWSSTVQGGLFTSKLSLGRTVVAPDQRGQPLQPVHVHEAMRRLRALTHNPADYTLLRGGLH